MKITPLDIRQKRFRPALRGLDRQEVEAFLELVAAEFEELVKETMALREDGRRKDEEIAEHRSRERALQETLVTAQKIVQGAHARFLRIVDDLNELKRQRLQFEHGVRSLVEGHLKLLEAFTEPQTGEQVEYIPGRKKGAGDA
jgi:cell division initiation protein